MKRESERWLQFAGATIYARGYDYYLSENFSELIYDPDAESISAAWPITSRRHRLLVKS